MVARRPAICSRTYVEGFLRAARVLGWRWGPFCGTSEGFCHWECPAASGVPIRRGCGVCSSSRTSKCGPLRDLAFPSYSYQRAGTVHSGRARHAPCIVGALSSDYA